MTNKRVVAALLAWTGLLTVVLAALLLFSNPTPSEAQTGVSAFGSVRVGAFYRAYPRTAITVTMNGWLTPTGTYQRIRNTSGAVATSGAKIAVKPAGTVLILVNSGSNSITFTETGTLISAGNIVLGANDSATLMSDGTSYYQVGASNN
jgi:hypothetical protein